MNNYQTMHTQTISPILPVYRQQPQFYHYEQPHNDTTTCYDRYVSADNKENRIVYVQATSKHEIQDSPKRINRSKSSLSYNTSSYLSPNNKLEVDRDFVNHESSCYRKTSTCTINTHRYAITNPKRLLFKFKVYATKVEKWQIDERGDEVPGGLLEVMHGRGCPTLHTQRIQPQEIVTPPPFKLLTSKHGNLPLPRESQELLAANIRDYNRVIERQNELASNNDPSAEVMQQLQYAEKERLNLFSDQIKIVKDFVPENRLYSQLLGSEHMAMAPYQDHITQTVNTGPYNTSGRTESLVSQINMAQILKVPLKIHHISGEHCNNASSPGMFESLINQAHDKRSPRDYSPRGLEDSNSSTAKKTSQNNITSNSNLKENPQINNYSSVKSDQRVQSQQGSPRQIQTCSAGKPDIRKPCEKTTQTYTSEPQIGVSEIHYQARPRDNRDRGAAVVSKDFNDWIEKGLFRQIENTVNGVEANTQESGKQAILSLIAEVPEDKSDTSPHKGNRSSQKKRLTVNQSSFDEQNNCIPVGQRVTNISKAMSLKEGSFYSASSYPQENVEEVKLKRDQSNEAGESQFASRVPGSSEKHIVSIPVITSQKNIDDTSQNNSKAVQWLSPVKLMGSVYLSQTKSNSNFKSKHLIEDAISEVRPDEEDEYAHDKRVKLMTPHQSEDFKAHKINTDCSCSMSHEVYSHEHGNHNLNVVFPSLKFSSAKVDKSIQLRTSLNVSEGQSMKLECNNFIYLDQAADERSNINAYMIEPIKLEGRKRIRIMQNEQVQTDAMSPFIATQVVEELLKSRDFATEIRRSAAQQPFTVTVEQDHDNNDYIINVQLSNDFNEEDDEDVNGEDDIQKENEARNTNGENENYFRIASKTESIREMSELGHTNHLMDFDFTKKVNFEKTQKLDNGRMNNCGPIPERDEHEGSQYTDRSDEEDGVTIDNPLLKEYDATASPDHHARNSRLEEIFQDGGFKSAQSDMVPMPYPQRPEYEGSNQIDNEEIPYYLYQPNYNKAQLCQITELSAEESEQLRISRQLNLASVENRDNQSEVFNSRAYEKLFGEPSQVSDSKYDRSKKGLKSMTAYHSKERLNTINEENITMIEPTNSFVEFIAKKDGNSSQNATLNSAGNTPKKKMVEIEDIILSQSKSKAKAETPRPSSKAISQDTSSKKLSVPKIVPVFDRHIIEPDFLECKKDHIYAIRHCEKRVKKSKSTRSIKKQEDKSLDRSKSPNITVQRKAQDLNKSATISAITDQDNLEMVTLQIPQKEVSSKRTIKNKVNSKDNSIDYTSQVSKKGRKTPNKTSPTPNRAKDNLMASDARSVSQIKKELVESSVYNVSTRGEVASSITQRTQKRTSTPLKSKNNSISEKPKAGKRETSPYAPEKYKSTIQTLFHDQMGPARKKTNQKSGPKAQEEDIKLFKHKNVKVDTSLTQFNQASDCDTYSVTSGNAREFMKGHAKGYNKTKSFAEKPAYEKHGLAFQRNMDDILEAEANKSHRSTRSHFPQHTQTGMAPLFEDVIAEHESTGKKSRGLKAASYTNISNKKPSATHSKVNSPQLGYPDVHQKINKPSDANSLSKHSQGKHSTQTFGYPDHNMNSRQNSQRQSLVRNSQADNLLRDKILNEFITGLCSTGILNEDDCANENFFIENEAIMIGFDGMVAVCAEMGFLPETFDPENQAFGR